MKGRTEVGAGNCWQSLHRFVLSKLEGRLAIAIATADIEAIHSTLDVGHPHAANGLLVIYRKIVNWAKLAAHLPKNY